MANTHVSRSWVIKLLQFAISSSWSTENSREKTIKPPKMQRLWQAVTKVWICRSQQRNNKTLMEDDSTAWQPRDRIRGLGRLGGFVVVCRLLWFRNYPDNKWLSGRFNPRSSPRLFFLGVRGGCLVILRARCQALLPLLATQIRAELPP